MNAKLEAIVSAFKERFAGQEALRELEEGRRTHLFEAGMHRRSMLFLTTMAQIQKHYDAANDLEARVDVVTQHAVEIVIKGQTARLKAVRDSQNARFRDAQARRNRTLKVMLAHDVTSFPGLGEQQSPVPSRPLSPKPPRPLSRSGSPHARHHRTMSPPIGVVSFSTLPQINSLHR